MYNWLKSLFGFRDNSENKRIENDIDGNNAIFDSLIPFEEDCNCNKMPVEGLNPEEIWPCVPLFLMDPFQIHKHFEKIVEDMTSKFNMHGFNNFPSLGFEDGKNDLSNYFEYPGEFSEIPPDKGNMRDYVLNKRPGINSQLNETRDLILNDHTDAYQIKDSLTNADQKYNSLHPLNKNQSFGSFQSVVLKIFKQPDGTVHIIKNVKDSNGKDETIYTIQSKK